MVFMEYIDFDVANNMLFSFYLMMLYNGGIHWRWAKDALTVCFNICKGCVYDSLICKTPAFTFSYIFKTNCDLIK